MINPSISILIPHLRTPANDAALKVALDCIVSNTYSIVDNTQVSYELIVMAMITRGDIYALYNSMAARASAEWIVFSNSDVFFAPGWAEPLLALAKPHRIVAGTLVECGAIVVSDRNIHKNFGMHPETFRRAEFETYTATFPKAPAGEGWYMPSLHNRRAFLEFGGFDTERGEFPEPLDRYYWNRWRTAGRYVVRASLSYAYHLQNYSNPEITRGG